jgi:hypothetical protein
MILLLSPITHFQTNVLEVTSIGPIKLCELMDFEGTFKLDRWPKEE